MLAVELAKEVAVRERAAVAVALAVAVAVVVSVAWRAGVLARRRFRPRFCVPGGDFGRDSACDAGCACVAASAPGSLPRRAAILEVVPAAAVAAAAAAS